MNVHSSTQDPAGWETLERQPLLETPHIVVAQTRVRTPERPEGASWTIIHRKAASVIVPVTAKGRYVLVRQERIPIRATLWEFPAGQLEEGDTPEVTALRELTEETGYIAPEGRKLQSLGHFYPSAGVMDEISYLFLVRPVHRGEEGPQLDGDEAITQSREFTADALRAMIADGEIRDASTLAAFARMAAAGLV